MIRAGALLVVLSGVSPCIAQEAPVMPPTPVVNAKPVATDNQMLHKYVWSTIGFDGPLSATLSSGLDHVRTSPTEWGAGREGCSRNSGTGNTPLRTKTLQVRTLFSSNLSVARRRAHSGSKTSPTRRTGGLAAGGCRDEYHARTGRAVCSIGHGETPEYR
jgi:hypothetical protein